MQERGWGGHAREVVARSQGEADVAEREGRDGAVQADGRPIERSHEKEGGAKRGDEHDEGRRKQTPGSACVERQQADPPGSLVLAQEEPGDEEAADDEEDVDADEAAGHPGQAGVKQDDDEDGQPAQALDVGAKSVVGAGRGGCGHDHVTRAIGHR